MCIRDRFNSVSLLTPLPATPDATKTTTDTIAISPPSIAFGPNDAPILSARLDPTDAVTATRPSATPPSSPSQSVTSYLHLFIDSALLKKMSKLDTQKNELLKRLVDEKECADISNQVLVIGGKIEMCKDANLVHQYRLLYAKYIETKKLIEQYHDSMIAPLTMSRRISKHSILYYRMSTVG